MNLSGAVRMLTNLACRRPRRVFAVAALVFVIGGPVGMTAFDALDPFHFEDPSTEAAVGRDRLEQASGVHGDADVIVLAELGAPARSSEGRAEIGRLASELVAVEGITQVATPFRDGDPSMISRDGRSAYVVGQVALDVSEETISERVEDRFAGNPRVTLGGSALATTQIGTETERDLQRAELLALPMLALLSLLFFRSVVAALIPLAVGGLAIVGSLFWMRLIHEAIPLSNLSINIVTALGFGLALDYALFMVSRFREELAHGREVREALEATLASTGRTIAFSALTIAAALAALLVFPQRFLVSMGIGGVMVALLAATVALTVLPALLAVLGKRVNAGAPAWLQRSRERTDLPDREGRWYRLAHAVMRRPVPVATAAIAILLVAGTPFLRANLVPAESSGVTEAPPGLEDGPSAGRVDRTLRSSFPPPLTSPIVVQLEGAAPARAMKEYVQDLSRLEGVEAVRGPRAFRDGVFRIDVATGADPVSGRAREVVRSVRAVDAPTLRRVTGVAAAQLDDEESVRDRLPLAGGIIAATTLALLFAMTGSVVLPFKVLVMNLVTVSVAFGILVFFFQDGRLEGLLDYTTQGGIQVAVPVLIFAVAFGLSTDYGVFTLSRIREAREAGADNAESVALGLERTGRLITAAALMFAVAMGALVTGNIIGVKEVGLGIAASVLIDATIIRALLVPSLMKLLGDLNWWAPSALRRLRPAAAPVPAPAGAGSLVDVPAWTAQGLDRELARFERYLRRAGIQERTVRTYVDRSAVFVGWLETRRGAEDPAEAKNEQPRLAEPGPSDRLQPAADRVYAGSGRSRSTSSRAGRPSNNGRTSGR